AIPMEKKVIAIGQKKTAKARSECMEGDVFSVTVNNVPLRLLPDDMMASKLRDIITRVGLKYFENLVFSITVRGGGPVSKIYAVRQAFAKSLVAYYGTYMDEWTRQEIRSNLLSFDKFTLVADPRRAEPKKYGGRGARARRQKSYR
uniref:uS9 n=1 Tax=Paranosema locustae TaxID=235221 RepID=UPI00187D6DFA|nr:Chain SQ0, uS9 [Paranosema locustae]